MKFEDYKNLVNKYYNKDCREINFQNRIIIPFLESIIPKEYDIVDSSTLYKNWDLYKDGQDRIGISWNSFAAKGTPDILITKDWELFAQYKSKPVLIIEIKRPTAIDRLHADSQVKEYINVVKCENVVLTDSITWEFYSRRSQNPEYIYLSQDKYKVCERKDLSKKECGWIECGDMENEWLSLKEKIFAIVTEGDYKKYQ